MIASVDQLGRKISLPASAQRIISLVPSITELLYDLGLRDEVVGITKFCIHPESWYRNKTRIGGTKNIDAALIRSLHPDLILSNKEENVREQVEELSVEFPTWISDIKSLDDAYYMIRETGMLTGKLQTATELIDGIRGEFEKLEKALDSGTRLKVLYFIWKDPWMVAGRDTFIHHLLERCGIENVISGSDRYPVLTDEELSRIDCDVAFLSSEPFPFSDKHLPELRAAGLNSKIFFTRGDYFSWYGSRLLKAPYYFRELISQINSHS